MNSLTSIVEQYKAILPEDMYIPLYQVAAEVSQEMIPVMEPAFRIELHKACEGYFQALKTIGKEMQEEKKEYLLEAERIDKQQEMSALNIHI